MKISMISDRCFIIFSISVLMLAACSNYSKVHKSEKKLYYQLEEVDNITDQNILKEIANNVLIEGKVRATAIRKVTNQEFLKTVANKNFQDSLYRIAALEVVNNFKNERKVTAALTITNNYNENNEFRIAAIECIIDQEYLKKIANTESETIEIRLAAIKVIVDQEYLKKIFNNENLYSKLRAAAAKGITDKQLLEDTFNNLRNSDGIRKAAIEGITDQLFLRNIYHNNKVGYVRFHYYAVNALTNLEYLIEIAQDTKELRYSNNIHQTAALRIQSLLGGKFIIINNSHSGLGKPVAMGARKKLSMLILKPQIIEKYGLLKVNYTGNIYKVEGYKEKGKEIFSFSGRLILIDHIIEITTLTDVPIFAEEFKASPAKYVETFSSSHFTLSPTNIRAGEIDYYKIEKQLLNK